ncbi:MAG: precorrin-6A reductase [Thermoleophilia bacterium]|jgi:precorrin-6x reductase/cob(I)alamin adenosyltransferase
MILLLGGTSDARLAASLLQERGYDVLLSVVSEHGADLARNTTAEDFPRASKVSKGDLRRADASRLGRLRVRVGALDEIGLETLLESSEAVVDATHPFAQQISALARGACDRLGVPYVRLERPRVVLPEDAMLVPDAATAAARAVESGGESAILVTVGTRTLRTYVEAVRAAGRRLVARVMPVEESIAHCRELGLAPADILAMQGPTGAELDAALLRHLGAGVLVTKESGEAGGLNAKLEACRAAGAAAIVVARPEGDAVDTQVAPGRTVRSVEELLSYLGRHLGCRPHSTQSLGSASLSGAGSSLLEPGAAGAEADGRQRLSRGLLQVYTGEGKGKTTAAVGLALRARGQELTVAMVQFLKGGTESGELAGLRLAGVHVVRPASRSTGLLCGAAHSEDKRGVVQAWNSAHELMFSGDWDLVILDELNVALHYGLLDIVSVLSTLQERPAHVEVVATGRYAPDELCAAADLVTQMVAHKHPYPDIWARRGIEY